MTPVNLIKRQLIKPPSRQSAIIPAAKSDSRLVYLYYTTKLRLNSCRCEYDGFAVQILRLCIAPMSRPDSEKCRLCAKLSVEVAQQRHGASGDGCWDAKYCHNRRSYYRHRGVRNYQRQQQRQQASQRSLDESSELAKLNQLDQLDQSGQPGLQPVALLKIPAPAAPAAVVYWYRETKAAPLHALSAELWMGNHRVAKIAPIHSLGLSEQQIRALLTQFLSEFSQHCGQKIERFRAAVELDPLNCPIRPCPLHPEVELGD